MAGTLLQTPYATAMPFIKTVPAGGWTGEYDAQRLASYDLYDDLVHNDPSQYKLMLRDANDKPIYVPTAHSIIHSLARYVGRNWGFKVYAPEVTADGAPVPTDEQIVLAKETISSLIRRERLLSKYRSGISEWLRRGDWLWMITADEKKPAGRRISITPIDPRRYFPVNGDVRNLSRVTGQQIIEETMIGDTNALLVQTWLKASDPAHPNYGQPEPEDGWEITYQFQAYDMKDYADPAKRKALAHPENLPQAEVPGITQLPIYHIRNNEETDDPFGHSDLAGIETLIAGINQSVSDEDLSLAMMGLGMYWTNSGAPVDESTGQATGWKLGPKRVIEVDTGTTFEKVDGITSVEPFQVHVGYLEEKSQGKVGLSDVSVGTADNVSAESGIALAIRFSPTADAVRAKNDNSNAVLTQMFFDLKQWLNVYEGIDLGALDIVSETDDDNLLPFDREGRFQELVDGMTAGFFDVEYVLGVLQSEFGYEFTSDDISRIAANAEKAAAAADPFAARANAEMAASDSADPAADQ